MEVNQLVIRRKSQGGWNGDSQGCSLKRELFDFRKEESSIRGILAHLESLIGLDL